MDGVVMRIRKDGVGGTQTLADGQAAPVSLVVDDLYVYWVTMFDSQVQRVPKTGGDAESMHQGGPGVVAIALDSQAIYWLDAKNQVFRLAK
jgi:hypothetical protein